MPRSQGVISFAHHSAKAEARGANPHESSNFIAAVPQRPQDEFGKLVFVAVRKHSVRVRPETRSGLWCNSSISAREADGPGANPGFLTDITI